MTFSGNDDFLEDCQDDPDQDEPAEFEGPHAHSLTQEEYEKLLERYFSLPEDERRSVVHEIVERFYEELRRFARNIGSKVNLRGTSMLNSVLLRLFSNNRIEERLDEGRLRSCDDFVRYVAYRINMYPMETFRRERDRKRLLGMDDRPERDALAGAVDDDLGPPPLEGDAMGAAVDNDPRPTRPVLRRELKGVTMGDGNSSAKEFDAVDPNSIEFQFLFEAKEHLLETLKAKGFDNHIINYFSDILKGRGGEPTSGDIKSEYRELKKRTKRLEEFLKAGDSAFTQPSPKELEKLREKLEELFKSEDSSPENPAH